MGEWDNYWEALNGGDVLEKSLFNNILQEEIAPEIDYSSYKNFTNEELQILLQRRTEKDEKDRQDLIREYELEQARIEIQGKEIFTPDPKREFLVARAYKRDGELNDVISKYKFLIQTILDVYVEVENVDLYLFRVIGRDSDLQLVLKLFQKARIYLYSEIKVKNERVSITFFHGLYLFEELIRKSIEYQRKKEIAAAKRRAAIERQEAEVAEQKAKVERQQREREEQHRLIADEYRDFILDGIGIKTEVRIIDRHSFLISIKSISEVDRVVAFLGQNNTKIKQRNGGLLSVSPSTRWSRKLNSL